jgi:5-formyltetrahydrofolate cyclo-ligase
MMVLTFMSSIMSTTSQDKQALRKNLVEKRANLADKMARIAALTQAMRIWLIGRKDQSIGAYWPIKGEFDPLPPLHRWKEDGELIHLANPRRIGLPVVDKAHKTLNFHVWYPGCDMEEDAYNIPKPKDTDVIHPSLLFVPCVGFTLAGGKSYRLGYGGGFYDRTLATLTPRPFTVGLAFDCASTHFEPEPHDMPLDLVLTEQGIAI